MEFRYICSCDDIKMYHLYKDKNLYEFICKYNYKKKNIKNIRVMRDELNKINDIIFNKFRHKKIKLLYFSHFKQKLKYIKSDIKFYIELIESDDKVVVLFNTL